MEATEIVSCHCDSSVSSMPILVNVSMAPSPSETQRSTTARLTCAGAFTKCVLTNERDFPYPRAGDARTASKCQD